jgi:hypothetical protein
MNRAAHFYARHIAIDTWFLLYATADQGSHHTAIDMVLLMCSAPAHLEAHATVRDVEFLMCILVSL